MTVVTSPDALAPRMIGKKPYHASQFFEKRRDADAKAASLRKRGEKAVVMKPTKALVEFLTYEEPHRVNWVVYVAAKPTRRRKVAR